MLIYNLGIIRKGSQILLLNRERSSWMGCWNGVGGKIEQGETPRASMHREMLEETGLDLDSISFIGFITWSSTVGNVPGGMYIYEAKLPEGESYPTPKATEEGILDWKELEWVLHPENRGVASNLPVFLRSCHAQAGAVHLHGYFDDQDMVDHMSFPLDASIDKDLLRTNAYLHDFFEKYRTHRTPVGQG